MFCAGLKVRLFFAILVTFLQGALEITVLLYLSFKYRQCRDHGNHFPMCAKAAGRLFYLMLIATLVEVPYRVIVEWYLAKLPWVSLSCLVTCWLYR